MSKRIYRLVLSSFICCLYVLLTYLSSLVGLSSGVIQFRLSECLCVLSLFTPAAIPGLALGCFLANLLTGALPFDLIFGSIATLLGAAFSYFLRRNKWIALLGPSIFNTLIIPFILKYEYGVNSMAFPLFFLTVFIGEFVTSYLIGLFLFRFIEPHKQRLFKE